MKRILVTGGAGFIGSHLCQRLLDENNDVICLDNFFTGSKDNIRKFIGDNHFELVRHDVTKEYFAEVDQIYNLACPASPPHYQYDAVKTIKTSVLGIINMLDLARECKATILICSVSPSVSEQGFCRQVQARYTEILRCIHRLRLTEVVLIL